MSSESEESGGDDDMYNVEKIVAVRKSAHRLEYRVRWEGYGPKDDEWKPREDLNCRQLFEDFWKEPLYPNTSREWSHNPSSPGKYTKKGEQKLRKLMELEEETYRRENPEETSGSEDEENVSSDRPSSSEGPSTSSKRVAKEAEEGSDDGAEGELEEAMRHLPRNLDPEKMFQEKKVVAVFEEMESGEDVVIVRWKEVNGRPVEQIVRFDLVEQYAPEYFEKAETS